MVDMLVTAVQVLLGLGAIVALVRGVRGPQLVDRMVALDVVLLLLAGSAAVAAARGGRQDLVPVVIVVALVAFASTVLVARFIEWRDVD
jgi:multicomponent Na+:H+ antiporter subunit F